MAKERDAMFNTPTDVALSTNDIEGYNLKTKKKIYVGSGTTELPEGYDWNLPKENSPITTSEPATANLSGLDEDILKTEDEMAKNEERYKNEQTRRDEELKRREDDITRRSKERQEAQEQIGKQITSESRAALAELGILSTEPGLVSATSATQYLADVANENQKEMDRIRAEEIKALQSARDAKDAGDFALANQQFEQAQSLRAERNKIRLDAAQEARAVRADERAGDTAKIQQAQEERAKKKYTQETAENAIKYIDWQNLDQYNPSEIDKLEQSIGLPKGTIDQYAEVALRAKAIEGWESQVYNDKNTGKVTAIYSRLNPKTGKPEYMEQEMGYTGERYQPIATPQTSDKITDSDRISEIKGYLTDKNLLGGDKKVSWETYLAMKQTWINNQGTLSDFTTNFPIGEYLDEDNQEEFNKIIKGE